MTLDEVDKWADEMNAAARSDDPRFRHSVLLVVDDGTVMNLENTYVLEKEGYVVTISEHMRPHVFELGDLVMCREVLKEKRVC